LIIVPQQEVPPAAPLTLQHSLPTSK